MGPRKYFKHIFDWFMTLAVYAILGPFVYMKYLILKFSIATEILELGKKECSDCSQTKKNVYSEKKPNYSHNACLLSPSEKRDFKMNRAYTYLEEMTFGSLWEISRFASGRQRVPLVSNHILQHVLFNSVFSYALQRDNNPQSKVQWRLSFDQQVSSELPRGCYSDVTEILILKSGRLNIRDRTGRLHTPGCKTWPLAKAHVQAQLTYFAPGLLSSPSRSLLPALIAREIGRALPASSVLRQLLEPHLRFTPYLHCYSVYDSLISSKSGKLNDLVIKPWVKIPEESKEIFDEDERRCEKLGEKNFPLVPTMDDEIPYQAFLNEYRDIFHYFVNSISPLLKNDFECLKNALSQYIPTLGQMDMVDTISGLMWNWSVVHYCDRQSYTQQWANKYGCAYVRTPLVTETKQVNISTITNGKTNEAFEPDDCCDKKDGDDYVINTQFYLADDGNNFFRHLDICRTRCILRAHVRYIPSPGLDLSLQGTKYQFSDSLATSSAREFFMNLHDMNSFLKQRGEAIVPGEDFTRGVCF